MIEDAATVGGLALAWFAPFLDAALILAVTIVFALVFRRLIAYVTARSDRRVRT